MQPHINTKMDLVSQGFWCVNLFPQVLVKFSHLRNRRQFRYRRQLFGRFFESKRTKKQFKLSIFGIVWISIFSVVQPLKINRLQEKDSKSMPFPLNVVQEPLKQIASNFQLLMYSCQWTFSKEHFENGERVQELFRFYLTISKDLDNLHLVQLIFTGPLFTQRQASHWGT